MAECEGRRRHRRKHHGPGIRLAKHRSMRQIFGGHHGFGALHGERDEEPAARPQQAGGRRRAGKPAAGQPQGVQDGHPAAAEADHRSHEADHQGWKVHTRDHPGKLAALQRGGRRDAGNGADRSMVNKHEKKRRRRAR
eukprot:1462041-Heterocapsa_arctica.AAC.1